MLGSNASADDKGRSDNTIVDAHQWLPSFVLDRCGTRWGAIPRGISTREYEEVLSEMAQTVGVSRGSVSREAAKLAPNS